MRRSRHRAYSSHFDALEPRRVLAQAQNLVDSDGDAFTIELSGPGTFVLGPFVNGEITTLQLFDTTSVSDLQITRTATGGAGNGLLIVNRITVSSDIDELRLADTMIRDDGTFTGEPNLLVQGRVRSVVLGEVIEADITITSAANTNKTTFQARRIEGGAGTTFCEIVTAGIIESFRAETMDGVGITARRMGDVWVTGSLVSSDPGGLTIQLIATEANATWGIKSIRIDDNLITGEITSASPIQSIRLESTFSYTPPGPGGLTRAANVAIFVDGKLSTMRTTDGPFAGSLKAASFGTIDIRGTLRADVGGNGAGSVPTERIDSLRTGEISGATIAFNRLLSLNAQAIQSSSIEGSVMGSMIVASDVLDLTMQLSGLPKTSFTINTLNIGGILMQSRVRIHGNTNAVTLGGIGDCYLGFGTLNPVTGFATSSADFDAEGGRVNSFKLKARPNDGLNFENSFINARQFVNISSTARYQPGPGPSFGFRFLLLPTTLSLRTINFGTVTNPAINFVSDPGFTYFQI